MKGLIAGITGVAVLFMVWFAGWFVRSLHKQWEMHKREAFLRGVQVGELRTKEETLREIMIVKENLERNLKSEFENQREATIRDMKASYDVLSVEYDDALKKAKIFDVDIHDKNFDNLLKGRLFEIFIVEMLTKNNDFTLLEWTPDKGFGKKIFVASNLHPDLVFKNREGEQFAIECKYRTGFNTFIADRYTDAVSWCKTKSFTNYQSFASKRNIKVWVALGVSGDPSWPDQLALVPAYKLANDSKKVFSTKDKVPDQYACKREKLQAWFVPNDHRFEQQCFLGERALVG